MMARDRDFFFPRLGFGSRMLGFRDPFEDFFTEPMLLDDSRTRLGNLWTDFGVLTPDAHMQHVAPVAVTDGEQKLQKKEADAQPASSSATESKDNKDKSVAASAPARNEGQQASSLVRSSGSDWLQSYMRAPQVEVVQHENEFIVKADLPGVRKEDVKVNIAEDSNGRKMLNISGERKEEETSKPDDKSTYTSRRYGKFSRSLLLPDGCSMEGIKAKQENGVLNIVMPRQPGQPKKTASVNVNVE